MQTQCPSCNTIFRVSQSVLEKADGMVRCGQCDYIFNGYDRLQQPEQETAQTMLHTPEVFKRMLLGQQEISRRAKTGWISGIVLATLLLAVQTLYLKRNELANHPDIGPFFTELCSNIPGCALKLKRDINRLQLVSRNVYSHPNADNALMINAVITNTANFSQPFPVLLVSMSNVRGKIVAERYFRPAEYLPDSYDPLDMQPGKAVPVNLEVMDPGQNALAFELDFL